MDMLRQASDESFLEDPSTDVSGFDRKLKAHREFEDDIAAQGGLLKDLAVTADALIQSNHYASESIAWRKDAVRSRWQMLLDMSAGKRQRLAQCSAYAAFLRDAAEAMGWIEANTTAAARTDVGDSLDTANGLLRGFEELRATLNANEEARITRVSIKALELISAGHPEHGNIERRQKATAEAYAKLLGLMSEREDLLDNALLIHEYNRDVDEAIGRIEEKSQAFAQPVALDGELRGVEELRRDHEALVIQTRSLEDDAARLECECHDLIKCFPAQAEHIQRKQQTLANAWASFKAKAAERSMLLNNAYDEKKFISDVTAYTSWSAKISDQIAGEDPAAATDLASADLVLQRHSESKGKIEAEFGCVIEADSFRGSMPSANKYQALVLQGGALIAAGHVGLATHLATLTSMKDELMQLWVQRREEFGECREYLSFCRNAALVETWMTKEDGALSTDVGDSLTAVDGLLRKHDSFEKSLSAQMEKMKELQQQCTELEHANHSQVAKMQARLKAVVNQRAALSSRCEARKRSLEASNRFQVFVRDARELQDWVLEKTKSSADMMSAGVSTSLRAKIQWHATFQTELSANESRRENVKKTSAGLLSEENHFRSEDVAQQMADVEAAWLELHAASKHKAVELGEADKVQQLRIKISDMEYWCTNTEHKLNSNDYGDSVQRTANLLKSHGDHEVEVVANRKAIDAVLKEGRQIIAEDNHLRDQVKEMLTTMEDKYTALEKPKQARRAKLQLAQDLHQFTRAVDVERKWIKTKMTDVMSVDYGSSVASVQRKLKKHENLQVEMVSRKKTNKTSTIALQLTETPGYSDVDVQAVGKQHDQLVNDWQELLSAAEFRKLNLDNTLLVQQYLADATEAEARLSKKRLIVVCDAYGTGEETLSLLTKHENERTFLLTYEKEIRELERKSKLCSAGSAWAMPTPSPSKKPSLGRVKVKFGYPQKGRDKKVKELAVAKGEVLTLIKCSHAEWWQVQRDGGDKGYVPASYVVKLDDEFEATAISDTVDVAAVTPERKSRPTTSVTSAFGAESRDVAQTQISLQQLYDECLAAADHRQRMLIEAKSLYELYRDRDAVLAWVSECEETASVSSLGTNLEHNELLQKQFDNFMKDLKVNASRLDKVKALGQRFIDSGHTKAEAITSAIVSLDMRWDALFGVAEARKRALAAAYEIHKFDRDVAEIRACFAEMEPAIASSDSGNDLATVETLLRKFDDAVARDIKGALEKKVEAVGAGAVRLCESQPDEANNVESKRVELETSWAQLLERAMSRKRQLDEALAFQQFLKDFREVSSWIAQTETMANADELATDQGTADSMLKQHVELQNEIDSRTRRFTVVADAGVTIAENGSGHHRADAEEKVAAIKGDLAALLEAMKGRKKSLEACSALQKFSRLAELADVFITAQETSVLSEDFGTSLESVESLQKKHQDFAKSLVAQGEQVEEVCAGADRLAAEEHYDSAGIGARKAGLQRRWEHLLVCSQDRVTKLAQAREVHQFMRDTDEIETEISEKLRIAQDPSYKDPTNLQDKVQKHSAFEAEIAASKTRVFSAVEYGDDLIAAGKGHADTISGRRSTLQQLWEQLSAESKAKGQKLDEARHQRMFNLNVEDIEFWLGQVERLVGNIDLGKDLMSAESLAAKHKLMVEDIQQHANRIGEIQTLAAAFVDASHFDAEKIRTRSQDIVVRYEAVTSLSEERSLLLQASVNVQKFLCDLEDEESWIREKMRTAKSEDYGKDLTSVKGMLHKQAEFDAVLGSHKEVTTLLTEATTLAETKENECVTIQERSSRLSEHWNELKAQSELRQSFLEQELAYQEYSCSTSDEASWIAEKTGLLNRQQINTDTLSTAENRKRKHATVCTDCEKHKDIVAAVRRNADKLVSMNNRSSDQISVCIGKLEADFAALVKLTRLRDQELDQVISFLQFNREADRLQAWMSDKMSAASSTEVGKDLASVEELVTKHDTFHASLLAFNESQLSVFTVMKEARATSDPEGKVEARHATVIMQITDLEQSSNTRRDALLTSHAQFKRIDALLLDFAKKGSTFNMWFENAEEDLSDPVFNQLNSLDEVASEEKKFDEFMFAYADEKMKFCEITELAKEIDAVDGCPTKNPYTWFTVSSLTGFWQSLDTAIEERTADLAKERSRQESNEELRVKFADRANKFLDFLKSTRAKMTEGSGSLESQLEETMRHHKTTSARKVDLEEIEKIGAQMEDLLILDNTHTEHTTVQLTQLWDQLDQLGHRMRYNLEQQIEQKNASGISMEREQEIEAIFRNFDEDSSGDLDGVEFKACLRASGVVLKVLENDDDRDPEFEAILASVDPNGDGVISLPEFRSFMITRETANADSSVDVGRAFEAAANGKPYITLLELKSCLSNEQANWCMNNMQQVGDAFDYGGLVKALFAGSA